MTSGPLSQCETCARFRSPFSVPAGPGRPKRPFCAAFPTEIPDRIRRNGLDHRYPIDGDHGLQWESNGEPFPVDAFLKAQATA
jgi:hypothetical protein